MSSKQISQAEFARMLGVKRQAINKAIREKRLVLHGKGHKSFIKLDDPATKAYIANGSGNRFRQKSVAPKASPKKTVTEAGKSKKGEPISKSQESNDELFKINEENYLIDQKTRQEKLKALQLSNAIMRGEYVRRDLIEEYVDTLFQIDNSQFKTLGLKTSSDIGAVFGVDDDNKIRHTCDIIENEVYKILKQIKREQIKFLKKLEANANAA
jgi:transcriptional regulator with XRE-family HTH domain